MLQVKKPSFVTVGGRRIAYDEISPAHPKGTILLLTGLGSTRLAWYKQLEVFGREYRTLALDHRDAGESFQATGNYTTVDQAKDVAAFLKALGISRTHLVGISMGGMISLELVLRHPDLIDKLVLVSTTAGGRSRVNPDLRLVATLMTPPWMRGIRLERGERALRTYSKLTAPGYFMRHPEDGQKVADNTRQLPTSSAAYYRQLLSTRKHDVVARLSRITAPTLVIHGESDRLIPPANGRFLAQNIPGAKLITYPDTGHLPIVEQGEDFNRDVLAFLG